jgi:hypothetical protein
MMDFAQVEMPFVISKSHPILDKPVAQLPSPGCTLLTTCHLLNWEAFEHGRIIGSLESFSVTGKAGDPAYL